MAAKAAPPDTPDTTDTTDTIQVQTMTKGTRSLNALRRVMEGIVRPGPVLRVSVVGAMAVFTGVIAKANIESRVAARSAEFAMAGLAGSQVGLGVLAVAGISFTIAITAI